MPGPTLEGEALAAVRLRGSHLQIIAAAGSGKTEVVAQRVADLLVEGVAPAGIVAFTFTERAAAELRHRIAERAEQRLGRAVLDQLGGLFVGTIHAYCFRLLQTQVPRYETYDVLDDHQLTAFLACEANRLELRRLDPAGRLFASITRFLQGVDVIENELLDPAAMPEPFRTVLLDYLDTLERYRLLTFGQQVVRAVAELEKEEVRARTHADLRHLIVDEPAQERLIALLTGPQVELCVVGDDDQAIYQWRGSDVSNIVTFADRYLGVATFEITTNRRSRSGIIDAANAFAATIDGRLPKVMGASRPPSGGADVVKWAAADQQREAGWLTSMILDLHDAGVAYRDIALLVRSRTSYGAIVEELATFDVPVQPGGRTGLFDQPEALVLGRTFAWMTNVDWRPVRGPGAPVVEDDLLEEYQRAFHLDVAGRNRVRRHLREWRDAVPGKKRSVDLVGELYDLLAQLDVRSWDLGDPMVVNRLGTLARFSALLADYESVRRRARPDADVAGEQVGGQDRGDWYYKNLAIHIVNYAQGAYEGFDGETDFELDAVDLTTVHRAKGLEWPAVFVPSMTANRFPTTRTGQAQDWLVPRDQFAAARSRWPPSWTAPWPTACATWWVPTAPRPRAGLRQGGPPRPAHHRGPDQGVGPGPQLGGDRRHPRRRLLPGHGQQARPSELKRAARAPHPDRSAGILLGILDQNEGRGMGGLQSLVGVLVVNDQAATRAVGALVSDEGAFLGAVGLAGQPPDPAVAVAEPSEGAEGAIIGEGHGRAVNDFGVLLERAAAGCLGAVEADAAVAAVTERLVGRLSAAAQGVAVWRGVRRAVVPTHREALCVGCDALLTQREATGDDIGTVRRDRHVCDVSRSRRRR